VKGPAGQGAGAIDPSIRRRAVGENLRVDLVASEVIGLFRRSGLDPILLKGWSFRTWLYADGTPRFYQDIDLLLASGEIDKAKQLLHSAGFARSALEGIPRTRPSHSTSWIRQRDQAMVELHTTLWGAGVSSTVLWALLSANTENAEIHGQPLRILNEQGRALHLALHVAQDGGRGKPSMDLSRAVEVSPLDVWKSAADLSLKLEADPQFAAGLRASKRGAEIAATLGLPVESSLELELRAGDATNAALSLDWIIRAAGFKGKVAAAAHKLFPPPSFMREKSRLAQHGTVAMVAAYAVRPFAILWRLPSALRAWLRASKRIG
jgi:hypothetical protein